MAKTRKRRRSQQGARRRRPALPRPAPTAGVPVADAPRQTMEDYRSALAADAKLDALIERNTAEILAGHQAVYKRTADPFAAWGAFKMCRGRGREIPDWVMRYFDLAVEALETVYFAAKAKRPARLARALGFSRPGAPKKPLDRDEELAGLVELHVGAAGGPAKADMKRIYYEVAAYRFGPDRARHGKGIRIVERAWQNRQKAT